MEILLPLLNAAAQLFFGIALIRLLELVDFSDDRTHALDLALVLRTNDFLKNPLKHKIVEAGLSAKSRSDTPALRVGQGRLYGKEARITDDRGDECSIKEKGQPCPFDWPAGERNFFRVENSQLLGRKVR